jgi:hypothetical protein
LHNCCAETLLFSGFPNLLTRSLHFLPETDMFPLSRHQPNPCFAAYLGLFLGQSVLLALLLEQLVWQINHEITAILFEQQVIVLTQQ